MIRRVLQMIAVMTVLAAILNAQCAAACAPAAQDHSCCKHHKSNCSQLDVHSTDATLDIHRADPPAPIISAGIVADTLEITALLCPEPPHVKAVPRPPSLTTLRI